MASSGPEDDLEARVRRLELRVEELEAELAVPRAPSAATVDWQAPVPVPAAVAIALAPAVGTRTAPAVAAVGATGWRPPGAGRDPVEGLRRFVADLDGRLAGRALAWAGGIALILGAIYFVSLASERGWIGPGLRIALGAAAGLASLVIGAVVMARGNRLIGHVLAPVGLAVVSISMVGATRLFDVLPVPLALVIVLGSALLAAWIAIRFDAPVVAGFGLVAVLIAPPLLGAPPDLATLVFVGSVLIGTTAVALWRAWGWLPPLAFLLSAPQVAVWIGGEPSLAVGLIGSIAYWSLQVIAAGGEAIRRHRLDLRAWSAGLLMGAAAFLVWCGFEVFDGELEALRPAFLLVVALVHLALGLAVLRRDGERSLFGLLTAATGVAALTMAVPVQLDAALVPVAWTAEAVAILWVGVERRHRPSLVGAAVLYGLAGAALLGDAQSRDTLPLVAMATFAVGIAAGTWLLRGGRGAHWLAASGVVALALVAGTGEEAVVAALVFAAVLVTGAVAWRWLDTFGMDAPLRYAGFALPALAVALLVAGGLAIWHLAATPGSGPIWEAEVIISTLIVAAGILGVGVVRRERIAATVAAIAAGATVVWVAPILDIPWLVVVVWSAIALAWLASARLGWLATVPTRIAGAIVLALAGLGAAAIAPPSRLVVGTGAVELEATLAAVVALGWWLVGVVALAWSEPVARRRTWLWLIPAVGGVYLASVVLMDVVGRLTVGLGPEERRTIGHTALTLLWAALGIGAFVVGLRARRVELRMAGLALLAVTTVKVVLVDLSGLDVAYRVVSLIGLGLVLLAGAWVWQRSQDRLEAETPGSGG